MLSSELTAFVEHARERGLDPMAIRMLLLSAGWKERDIAQALSAQALELPIPAPPDTGGARDAFLHLLTFAAFYTAAVSLIVLFFTYIGLALPDPAVDHPTSLSPVLSGIRRSLAALIVAFPLYLWLTRFLVREQRAKPEKATSGVRRWLTYLTLFVAAATLMCDLIVLVYHLLEGELSLRFLLKVVVLGVIAAATFVYYLRTLRAPGAGGAGARLHLGFGSLAAGLTAIAVIWGAIYIGSPAAGRTRRLDQRRVEHLQVIHNEVQDMTLGETRWTRGDRRMLRPLPQSLDELMRQARSVRPEIRDPETGEPYGYQVLGEDRYRLCARFDRKRGERMQPRWNHPAGHHCFDLNVLQDEPITP
ncbi:MAG: DUF5671 domain-containing protein [Thermoanaerobaculia bacterium]